MRGNRNTACLQAATTVGRDHEAHAQASLLQQAGPGLATVKVGLDKLTRFLDKVRSL